MAAPSSHASTMVHTNPTPCAAQRASASAGSGSSCKCACVSATGGLQPRRIHLAELPVLALLAKQRVAEKGFGVSLPFVGHRVRPFSLAVRPSGPQGRITAIRTSTSFPPTAPHRFGPQPRVAQLRNPASPQRAGPRILAHRAVLHDPQVHISQRGFPWCPRLVGWCGRSVLRYASSQHRAKIGCHGKPQRRQVPSAVKPAGLNRTPREAAASARSGGRQAGGTRSKSTPCPNLWHPCPGAGTADRLSPRGCRPAAGPRPWRPGCRSRPPRRPATGDRTPRPRCSA